MSEKEESAEERIKRRLIEVEQAALADDAPREVTSEWGASVATTATVLAEELARLDDKYALRPKECPVCHHEATWLGGGFACQWVGCPNEGAHVV